MARVVTVVVLLLGGISVTLLAQALLFRDLPPVDLTPAPGRKKASYNARWAASRRRVPPVGVCLTGTVLASIAAVVLLASGNWTLD